MCRNNEIKFTGQFGEQGVKYTLDVPKGQQDVLTRQARFCFRIQCVVLDKFQPAVIQLGDITVCCMIRRWKTIDYAQSWSGAGRPANKSRRKRK